MIIRILRGKRIKKTPKQLKGCTKPAPKVLKETTGNKTKKTAESKQDPKMTVAKTKENRTKQNTGGLALDLTQRMTEIRAFAFSV